MKPIALYARREPTTDPATIAYVPPAQRRRLRDVVFYATPAAARDPKNIVARMPWHYTESIPRRSAETVVLNCCRYRLYWLKEKAR